MKNLLGFLCVFHGLLLAESLQIPAEGWEPEPSPLASEWAEPGGTMRVAASQYPKSFNYYLDNNVFSSQLFSYLYDSLLTTNGLTLVSEPSIAEKVVVSEDKTTFTVHLDPKATWSDGKPISAEDVIWTFEAIMKPENLTGPHKVSLARFETPVKVDERTVIFTAKQVHWKNLLAIGGIQVLPAHWWKDQPFNEMNFEFPVVSGSYQIKSLNEPDMVVLEKRDDYWAAEDPRGEGTSNFDFLEFWFYPDRNLAFDNFKAGSFDIFAVYRARRWAMETQGDAFQKNWMIRQAIHNSQPVGFQGFAMNMRRKPFDDVRVRKALAHLLDRKRMNATLMFNQYQLTSSYFPDIYPEGNPNALLEFDVAKARALFQEAGWTVNDEGKLTKEGKPFVIQFLTRSPTSDQFLIIYREALEQVGIELNIVRKDWSAWTKDMGEFNYDMTWAAWGAGLFKDPESMWHSKYKEQQNGNNITGFADERVDALIDQTMGEFDIEKRHEIVREIDSLLVEQVPYVLLWHTDFVRLLYWNRFGMPDQVLTKYGSESAAQGLWWLDVDMDADLEAAKKSDKKLPPRPAEIRFEEQFDGPVAVEPMN
ncbi:extracellular solute-binding protein [Kiritimatiellaeota bacterium B1221]|nr:extracellular solute-binding protein [Kiritimatiellaeota bacterium B1221]